MEKYMNQRVIVRGDRSGVFYGTMTAKNGQEVELTDCRRLWYWNGAASISQIATEGVKKPFDCKFTVSVENMVVLDAIEILLCTDQACKNIESVATWRM